ncbi:hypothetical protein J6590_063911 [Homalodisca vitripennis]|nr:hypothetical protein J6590_063911 [Homalodisca vitripennis]
MIVAAKNSSLLYISMLWNLWLFTIYICVFMIVYFILDFILAVLHDLLVHKPHRHIERRKHSSIPLEMRQSLLSEFEDLTF